METRGSATSALHGLFIGARTISATRRIPALMTSAREGRRHFRPSPPPRESASAATTPPRGAALFGTAALESIPSAPRKPQIASRGEGKRRIDEGRAHRASPAALDAQRRDRSDRAEVGATRAAGSPERTGSWQAWADSLQCRQVIHCLDARIPCCSHRRSYDGGICAATPGDARIDDPRKASVFSQHRKPHRRAPRVRFNQRRGAQDLSRVRSPGSDPIRRTAPDRSCVPQRCRCGQRSSATDSARTEPRSATRVSGIAPL